MFRNKFATQNGQLRRKMASASASRCLSTSSMSVYTDCFASPPEPRFQEPQNGITAELLKDTLKLLASKNEIAVNSATPGVTGLFKDHNTVLFLFELCRHLGLDTEVQYRAVELFHRFMVKHIEELYGHVQCSVNTVSPIKWADVEQRLKHQITLRAISCVQLASKLSSHYHLVTINRARLFLSKCGFRYTQTSVVQSEVRVLKAINFRVHDPTPLEYIEALLETLGKENKDLPVKQLHGISLKLLDVFYLTRETVFANFFHLLKLRISRKGKAKPVQGLEVNSMVLAASIITAASVVLYEIVDVQWVLVSVCDTANVETQDVVDYSWVLMREVLSDNQDTLEDY